jgi:DNA-binding MarR family transcriptional regulator
MVDREESLSELEQQVTILLRQVRQFVSDQADAAHPELQAGGYHLLGWLERNGPLRASAVVEELRLDKGAVSRKLNHLQDLGFLERTPDPADGRATLVSVTERGREQLAAAADWRRSWLRQRLDGWSADDLALLVTMLSRYNAALR